MLRNHGVVPRRDRFTTTNLQLPAGTPVSKLWAKALLLPLCRMKRTFDKENVLAGSSWPPSDIDGARNLSIHLYDHPQPLMDSQAELEYDRFLQDTITAAGQDGLFVLASYRRSAYLSAPNMFACPCSRVYLPLLASEGCCDECSVPLPQPGAHGPSLLLHRRCLCTNTRKY